MEDNARNNRNVFIRGNDSRGDEVISVLSDFGGLNNYCFDGSGKDRVYFINHVGFIDYEEEHRELAKIIMDNYREIKLPEQWKDGDVLVNKEYENVFSIFKNEDREIEEFSGTYLFADFDSRKIDRFQYINNSDFRLATSQEVEKFYEFLHKYGKDWDAEKKQLVDWRWEPEYGGAYYMIGPEGNVSPEEWTNSIFDIYRLSYGNCFRTCEEAGAMAEKIKELLKGGTV